MSRPLPCMGEDELIRRAQAGDPEAFRSLLEEHYGSIYKIAFAWCGRREEAQDIAQEVCLVLARRLRSYRFEAAFPTWLYRVTLNVAKDRARAAGTRPSRGALPLEEAAALPSPEPDPERWALGQDLWRAIGSLPAHIKEAVILVVCQGLSHRDAALVLDCAESTVSWRLHEARKSLARHFPELAHHG